MQIQMEKQPKETHLEVGSRLVVPEGRWNDAETEKGRQTERTRTSRWYQCLGETAMKRQRQCTVLNKKDRERARRPTDCVTLTLTD